jgi:ATP-dependent DNA ligase I
MRLAEIVETSRAVAATPARLEKVARLAAALGRLSPDEAEIGASFLSGEPRQRRIGVGPAALRAVSGGAVAGEPALSLADVDAALSEVAGLAGPGSAAERQQHLGALFARATPEEQQFLARLLLGELRQGALEGVLVDAVARASCTPACEIRRAAMAEGRLATVAAAALAGGTAALARFRMRLFSPVQPMLAQTAEGLCDAVARLGEAALEFKLDGARVQVHRVDGEVRVFTRSLRDVTAAVPEVVEAVRALPARALVLDGEAISLRADGRPRPFQETMRRFGRKLEVAGLVPDLPMTAWFFDVLHVDGDDLAARPARERLAALDAVVPAAGRVPRLVTGDPEAAARFLDEAISRGHEGLVAKSLDAPYEAGNRGASWLKVKPAHTLDLVVLAAEWGHGRRSGWLSNLHLGARDPRSGGFAMLGKTFKGMTDELLMWQTEHLRAIATGEDDWVVHVRPELVVEVAFDGVQASRYPCGLALRFARVKRYRTDKRADEADTIDAVRALFGREHRATEP